MKEPKHVDSRKAKVIANWVQGELVRLLKDNKHTIKEANVEPAGLVQLLLLIDQGKINQQIAKQVFAKMYSSGKSPSYIIDEEGLTQIDTADELGKILDVIIGENQKAVEDYKKGKEQSFKFLIGQVMRKTKGKANPKIVSVILSEKLK